MKGPAPSSEAGSKAQTIHKVADWTEIPDPRRILAGCG